jgi:hypothetical protein
VLPSAIKRERPRFPETVSNLPFRALCGDVYSHTVGRRGVLARKTTGYQSNQRQCTPWGSVGEYHFRAVQGGAESGLRWEYQRLSVWRERPLLRKSNVQNSATLTSVPAPDRYCRSRLRSSSPRVTAAFRECFDISSVIRLLSHAKPVDLQGRFGGHSRIRTVRLPPCKGGTLPLSYAPVASQTPATPVPTSIGCVGVVGHAPFVRAIVWR